LIKLERLYLIPRSDAFASPAAELNGRRDENSAEDTYTLDIEIANRFVVGARTESRDLRVDRGQSHGSKNNHLQRHPYKNHTKTHISF